MNIKNIDKTIAIMERVKQHQSLLMGCSQTDKHGKRSHARDLAATQEELHSRGDKASLAGHIAISGEWKEDGGGIDSIGWPERNGHEFEDSIADWWGIHGNTASYFTDDFNIPFFPVPFSEVTPDHVIEKLQELKELGEQEFAKKYSIELS